jgi:hypothetical protein
MIAAKRINWVSGKAVFFGLLMAGVMAGCTKPSSEVPPAQSIVPSLSVSTVRLSTSQFQIVFDASNLSGFSISDVQVQISNGTAGAWTQTSSTNYVTTVTSTVLSGEVAYTISWSGSSYSRTALIFPFIDSKWNQPEAVPGYVNTNGWEDSPEISPDGKYLIVSTYSPVALFQCIVDGALRGTAACNQNSYQNLLTERPQFPGASRILSSTSINHTIAFLDPPDTTSAFPPVSSYVFQIQSDLTFKNPKPVYIDWEAYTWGAPFGFNFRKQNSSDNYDLYLAFGDPALGNGNKLQRASLDFAAADLKLGKIERIAGSLVKSDWLLTPLSIPGLASQTGNPSSTLYGGGTSGFLFWDDESLAANQREIFFATEASDGVLGSKQTVGLANAGLDKYQPYFHGDKLYYSFMHGLILSQQLLNSTDLTQAANWTAATTEIGVDTGHVHSGRISAIGEPTLFTDTDGKRWLYFAYAVSTTGSGLNLNIGRVKEN